MKLDVKCVPLYEFGGFPDPHSTVGAQRSLFPHRRNGHENDGEHHSLTVPGVLSDTGKNGCHLWALSASPNRPSSSIISLAPVSNPANLSPRPASFLILSSGGEGEGEEPGGDYDLGRCTCPARPIISGHLQGHLLRPMWEAIISPLRAPAKAIVSGVFQGCLLCDRVGAFISPLRGAAKTVISSVVKPIFCDRLHAITSALRGAAKAIISDVLKPIFCDRLEAIISVLRGAAKVIISGRRQVYLLCPIRRYYLGAVRAHQRHHLGRRQAYLLRSCGGYNLGTARTYQGHHLGCRQAYLL